MEKVKVGIVGCGNISGIYFKRCKAFEMLEVVACADLLPERAKKAAEEHGLARACPVEELLADDDIRVVVNLTVPKAHYPVAQAALEAGKSVHNEKPLALTRQEGRRLLETARERGLLFLVDAAQSAGVVPIDVEADAIDLLAFPGHKGLLGPMGTGGLYIGPRVDTDALRPLSYGGTGGNSEEDVPPRTLPARYEAGTLNAVGLAGLAAGVRFVLEQGIERILAHERSLADRLAEGLAALPGVRVYAHPDPARRTAVVSFTVEG